ncbi:hypothetical protein CIP107537_00959 [Corynebacterium diphtheriae]|nr:hypothetical protein CIP107537_00959 [Corynebacterium diphtheriae]
MNNYNQFKTTVLQPPIESKKSVEEGLKLYQEAEEILFKDLPAIPLWYANVNGGSSDKVSNVTFNWKSVAAYEQITKG